MGTDVLVIGGGNAALCAALMAAEAGASVLLLEAAPRELRGGNSGHTRNLRCMHDAPQDVLVEAYPEEEYWQDLLKVTGGLTNEHLARLTIRASSTCRDWMRRHGVHFQPPLSGALHVARTNAFFMGGGKALVNAYYRSAQRLGVQVRYQAPVDRIELQNGRFVAAWVGDERITAKTCVLAAGGFESNRAWLREAWGQNERGEWPADNFLIRGTRFNQGTLLRHLIHDHGADQIGDATQAHMVAIDARAPLYDGGICTRIDCVSLGVVVNREARRFYDEGEDFWPKRYAIWGRLVAQQPGQIAWSIIDAKAVGRFMPPVFPGVQANTLPDLARPLGLDAATVLHRLFWEEPLARFEPLQGDQGPRFACRCNRERVSNMLRGLGQAEAEAILAEQGQIEIGCDFCGVQYRFDAVDAAGLFKPVAPNAGEPGARH